MLANLARASSTPWLGVAVGRLEAATRLIFATSSGTGVLSWKFCAHSLRSVRRLCFSFLANSALRTTRRSRSADTNCRKSAVRALLGLGGAGAGARSSRTTAPYRSSSSMSFWPSWLRSSATWTLPVELSKISLASRSASFSRDLKSLPERSSLVVYMVSS